MSETVLGKRTRRSTFAVAEEVAAKEPRQTRSSRRTTSNFVIDNNENENPFITRHTRQHDDEADELALDPEPVSKRSRTSTAPSKHGAPESRVPLSPQKISKRFKSSKPTAAIDSADAKSSQPQTPRHRDAPKPAEFVTPRHRVSVPGKPLTPRTPHTPHTPHAGVTVYNEVRKMFSRTVATGQLVGRETEKMELQAFLSTHLENGSSGCLYISGPPGTGKSAMVNEITSESLENGSAKTAYINCMSVKTARDMCLKLLEEFGALEDELEGSPLEHLKMLLCDKSETRLIILDEVDHLLDVDLELLYSVFEWSLDPSSSLVLIGIANALDLTDRFLPRLKARGLKPDLLPFMPYTAPQIVSVLNSKLRSLLPAETQTPDLVPFLHPAAIQFISKKVASQTGDLRKAFEIARRAIDLVETETRDQHLKKLVEQTPTPSPSPSKTPLVENMNLSSPPTPRHRTQSTSGPALASSLAQLTVETAPRATIAHAARVTASAFNNGSSTRLRGLNLQQKAVLCALASLEHKLRSEVLASMPTTPSKTGRADVATAPTIKALYSSYTAACKRDNALHPLTATEFRDVVSNLETLSLIAAVDGKSSSSLGGSTTPVGTPSRRGRKPAGFGTVTAGGWGEDRRLASRVAEKELAGVLEGVGSGILKRILEGEN